VLAIMGAMGYRKRTGFLAGLTVAQISEFSLIFMAMGLTLGHVDAEAVGLVTVVGLVTIGLSTYMILYSQQLYARLERFLMPFERAVPHREREAERAGAAAAEGERVDALLFGLGRYGGAIHARLTDHGLRVLGVDFDPEVVREWQARGHLAVYGDVLDPEFPATLPLRRAGWAISTIPAYPTGLTHDDPRATLIQALRGQGFGGRIAVAAGDPRDAQAMRERGADLVLMPFLDAADQAVDLILGRDRRAPPRAPEAVARGAG
ncbi:MAG TPA: NAD-binding protein, partial [Geminicoccaceae bacterium]|nr:NAD-binding protein [Geminicoccaceae bacterium]